MIRLMPFQSSLILSIVTSIFKDRADLMAENVALRHQLSCLRHRGARPKLRRVIRSYVDYYHSDRTHLGLEKDAPEERPIEPRELGTVVAFPRVGGLHHRYARELQRAA